MIKNNKNYLRFLTMLFIVLMGLATIIIFVWVIIKKVRFNKFVVVPINKQSIIFSPTKDLKSFYENMPNTKETVINPKQEHVIYTINNDGLNERFDYEIKKPPNTFRIITLGDSFTFGVYTNTKDNWPEKLEDLLNKHKFCVPTKKIEVINLGVPGYDIAYAVKRFENRGNKYQPDLVIWSLTNNDFLQINEVIVPKFKKYSISIRKNGQYQKLYEEKGVPYPDWSLAYSDTIKELGKNRIADMQKRYLKEFNAIYQGKLMIATFPFFDAESREIIKNAFKNKKNFIFTDELTDIIHNVKDGVFVYDMHPTLKGYGIMAQDFYEYLVKNKVISCN